MYARYTTLVAERSSGAGRSLENQTADVRLQYRPRNDFWFTDDGNNPVAVLRLSARSSTGSAKFTSSITDVLPEDVHSYKKPFRTQMINRLVSFYLALADSWLLVNEQQPVYQFRIRNQYNGMTTEWNSVADKVIEVIKMQPENR